MVMYFSNLYALRKIAIAINTAAAIESKGENNVGVEINSEVTIAN